jgi:hypothetical protein
LQNPGLNHLCLVDVFDEEHPLKLTLELTFAAFTIFSIVWSSTNTSSRLLTTLLAIESYNL